MVDEFTNEITDGNAPSVNLSSVIFCPLLNLLVIKQYYYRRIYGRNRRVKKNYPLHSVGISLEIYHR